MESSIGDVLVTIVALLVIIIFVGAVYTFFEWVLQFIFSGGDEQKVQRVFFKMRYVLVGIGFTLLFLFVLPVIFKRAWLDEYQSYTAPNIFDRVSYITRLILNFWLEAEQVNRY